MSPFIEGNLLLFPTVNSGKYPHFREKEENNHTFLEYKLLSFIPNPCNLVGFSFSLLILETANFCGLMWDFIFENLFQMAYIHMKKRMIIM